MTHASDRIKAAYTASFTDESRLVSEGATERHWMIGLSNREVGIVTMIRNGWKAIDEFGLTPESRARIVAALEASETPRGSAYVAAGSTEREWMRGLSDAEVGAALLKNR